MKHIKIIKIPKLKDSKEVKVGIFEIVGKSNFQDSFPLSGTMTEEQAEFFIKNQKRLFRKTKPLYLPISPKKGEFFIVKIQKVTDKKLDIEHFPYYTKGRMWFMEEGNRVAYIIK